MSEPAAAAHFRGAHATDMAIIPLITTGNHPTVVTTQEDFQRSGGVEGPALLLQGLAVEQLSQEGPNTSYDLRVGQEYRDHRDAGKRDLPAGGTVTLHSGAAMIIETEEILHVPRGMLGSVVPRVSLLQQGLSNPASRVDPGYHGHLLITVFNLGRTSVVLQRGAPFCSLCMQTVKPGARLYAKQANRIEGRGTSSSWHTVRDWLQRNSGSLTAALLIVTTALLTVQLLSLISD